MAKRKTKFPVRKRRDRSGDDDGLLLRSAESLGRVIGALQRELDKAAKRLAADENGSRNRTTPRAKKKTATTGKRVRRAMVASERRAPTRGATDRRPRHR